MTGDPLEPASPDSWIFFCTVPTFLFAMQSVAILGVVIQITPEKSVKTATNTTLTEAAEQALSALGVDASEEAVRHWIDEKYGSEFLGRFAKTTLRSTVFVAARKQRTRLRDNPEPTIHEVLSVRQLIEKDGIELDTAELYLPLVGQLIERVGSAEKLQKVIAFLREIKD